VDFRAVFDSVSEALRREGIEFALIGGFALAALGVPRVTGDLDFLVAGEHAESLDRIMRELHYHPLHQFLPILGARDVKVVQAEDLIGLKVQSSTNDPTRMALDVGDIDRLLATGQPLDLDRVREYFRLFDREAELDTLLTRRGRS
jgi:predicted nucleotidyltransferase